jgi:pyridoxamine 5'-phosphate oxidase
MDGAQEREPIPALDDPLALFADWLAEAERSELRDANAMVLATATPDGTPSARTVLLKGWDENGFVFYTNFNSRKGDELQANPLACLLFYWKSVERQIRIEGPVAPVTADEADAYFASRPRDSQLGAWASDQSQPMDERQAFLDRLAEVKRRYADGDVPRPPHWSGFRVAARRMEFWQAMPFRHHDRLVYHYHSGRWTHGRLYP